MLSIFDSYFSCLSPLFRWRRFFRCLNWNPSTAVSVLYLNCPSPRRCYLPSYYHKRHQRYLTVTSGVANNHHFTIGYCLLPHLLCTHRFNTLPLLLLYLHRSYLCFSYCPPFSGCAYRSLWFCCAAHILTVGCFCLRFLLSSSVVAFVFIIEFRSFTRLLLPTAVLLLTGYSYAFSSVVLTFAIAYWCVVCLLGG